MITKECFGCGNVTAHQHLHDCAHGIAETHIVGSERFVCELCGHVTQAGSRGAERFPLPFDTVRASRSRAPGPVPALPRAGSPRPSTETFPPGPLACAPDSPARNGAQGKQPTGRPAVAHAAVPNKKNPAQAGTGH